MIKKITLFLLFLCPSLYGQNFFNTDVILYEPIIDVVNTGSSLTVQPTASKDQKYVTVSADIQISQLIDIKKFPVAKGLLGFVGIYENKNNNILKREGMYRTDK